MLYKLEGGAGLRTGEGQGRRFRDIAWEAPVLPSLRIWSQFQDEPLKTKRGDDTKERMAPLSPWLSEDLRDWWRIGWAKRYGRLPTLDDFICADPATMKAYKRGGLPTKCVPPHCELLDLPNKGRHGLRRHFITQARRGGARADMLERVTHNSSGDMIDVYTDAEGIWPALCEAVLCLEPQWPNEDNVLQLPVAVGDDTDKATDNRKSEVEKLSNRERLVAPAIGLEPMTKRLTVARSTN